MLKMKRLFFLVLFMVVTVNITACNAANKADSEVNKTHDKHADKTNMNHMDMHKDHDMDSNEMHKDHNHNDKDSTNNQDAGLSYYYTCPMHPEIKQDKPGVCPICNMTLEKREIKKNEKS